MANAAGSLPHQFLPHQFLPNQLLPRTLGFVAMTRQIKGRGVFIMPLPQFLLLIAFVMVAAGLTLGLAFWAEVPLLALTLATLTGSLALGLRRWL
jgi:hypothetical protein